MTNCQAIPKKKDQICIGDLDSLIKIQIRTKEVPGANATAATIDVTDNLERWARHDSANGEVAFNSSNLEVVITDKFYIRYEAGLDIADSIEKNGIRYKILDIEDLNGNNDFLLIKTSRRGDGTLKNNYL